MPELGTVGLEVRVRRVWIKDGITEVLGIAFGLGRASRVGGRDRG